MGSNSVDPAEIFQLLESNKSSDVDKAKQIFHNQFLSTKDSCLVNGLFDYFLSKNSIRAIEVLSSVRDPHDKHLLDRLSETLSKSPSSSQRVQVLTILGYIARRQPTWIYKLTSHTLFKELLKLLKVECDSLSIVSALFLLVMLIPMLAATLGPYLNEIFEVFIHLASHHQLQSLNLPASNVSHFISKDQLYLHHINIGLHYLFHRLYAMYPFNFISFLRSQYTIRGNDTTFKCTIKPLIDSVRMHPLLITASKDAETNAARWKKMEHHDVVAECGHFALDRSREELFAPISLRATPLLDQQSIYTPVNMTEGLLGSAINSDKDDDNFWSPSMCVPPQSPKTLATSHEMRSTPSTPNNSNNNSSSNINNSNSSSSNNNSSSNINNSQNNASPPEAAIEATPETTPVKELRQITRQTSISSAVRALSNFGNGPLSNSSRPSTPVISGSANASAFVTVNSSESVIVTQKMNRIFADRNNFMSHSSTLNFEPVDRIIVDNAANQNGKNDSYSEDQEVSDIVNLTKTQINYMERRSNYQGRMQMPQKNLTNEFKRLCSNYSSQASVSVVSTDKKVQRSKSCSDMKLQRKLTQEAHTQTQDFIPYEHILNRIVDPKNNEQQQPQTLKTPSDACLSPTIMLDRYIEACARVNSSDLIDKKLKYKKKGIDDDGIDNLVIDDGASELESTNQHLQLMQMQLLFERQQREVHAERNRRLLGKLRNSRALEDQNKALTDRLSITESEVEQLKGEIERGKRESRANDDRSKEAVAHWQNKCLDEQQTNRTLRERVEMLELDLQREKKKLTECEYQARAAEAALFDAGHQLKDALKAASHAERLKKILDNVQKKFLLLGEAQVKCLERISVPVPQVRQEAVLMQKSYIEEVANLQRQLDTRKSTIEALKTRLVELEKRETDLEIQLVDQSRLLQEAQERNDAELRAVESKYKALVSINMVLESRILELHGNLEAIKSRLGSNTASFTYSESPKERSPPLSGSLASSSEGSLAFHSSTGIMNDYNDSAGEISNLQAIVEPAISTSSQATPSRRE